MQRCQGQPLVPGLLACHIGRNSGSGLSFPYLKIAHDCTWFQRLKSGDLNLLLCIVLLQNAKILKICSFYAICIEISHFVDIFKMYGTFSFRRPQLPYTSHAVFDIILFSDAQFKSEFGETQCSKVIFWFLLKKWPRYCVTKKRNLHLVLSYLLILHDLGVTPDH